MEEKSNNWEENKMTGDFAESIVSYLINSMEDWCCVKYGIENHIDQLKNKLKGNSQDGNSLLIRSMPDFIAINEKENKVLIIDVKFRSFIDRRQPGEALYGFTYAKMKDYLKFWPNAHLIVVHNHSPFFTVIPLDEVEWYKHFHSRQIRKDGILFEQWNFAGVEKKLRDIFPKLSDDIISKAEGMIPKKK